MPAVTCPNCSGASVVPENLPSPNYICPYCQHRFRVERSRPPSAKEDRRRSPFWIAVKATAGVLFALVVFGMLIRALRDVAFMASH